MKQEITMHIDLTGHHIDITDAIRDFVQSKFARLERHFDNMTNVHVILNVEKDRMNAEATIQVSQGNIFADARHEDMYAAIDALVDKLDRQLKKHKEKLTDHHRRETTIKNQEIS